MTEPSKRAVVLIANPMLRKGLSLLLTDMQFSVIASSSVSGLEEQIVTPGGAPDLMMLSCKLDAKSKLEHQDDIQYVYTLRERYSRRFPVMILNQDGQVLDEPVTADNMIIVPEQIKPSKLREKIKHYTACLNTTNDIH